jgi:hypothetical protein
VRAIDVVPYRVTDLFLLQVVVVVVGWDKFLTLAITQFQLGFVSDYPEEKMNDLAFWNAPDDFTDFKALNYFSSFLQLLVSLTTDPVLDKRPYLLKDSPLQVCSSRETLKKSLILALACEEPVSEARLLELFPAHYSLELKEMLMEISEETIWGKRLKKDLWFSSPFVVWGIFL